MTKQKKAIVIGSGVAGLSSACLLASKNYKVTVYEAASSYGGKLGEFKSDGFRFDKGPSLFTLPHLLDQVFESCGENPRNYFDYKELNQITKYFFSDQTIVNAYTNVDAFKKELVNKCGEDAQELDLFFKKIEAVYNYISPIFLEHPIREFYKNLPGGFLHSLKMFSNIEAFKTLNASNSKQFKNPKTVQIFDRFATYNGSNPYKAPATLNVIPHLEHQLGAYYVNGGMRNVVNALYQLAQKMGVDFQFNSLVKEIVVKDRKATGIRVQQKIVEADQVFCNMDINFAYPRLLKTQKQPKIYLKQEKSSSALVFYWGMKEEFKELDVHNILFSDNYKGEFDCLSNQTITNDPTVYIYISSKADKKDAPESGENWFTMINVPSDTGQDWETLIEKARSNILNKINKTLGRNVSSSIRVEKVLSPKDIESQTASIGGALYGNSSNNIFAAFLRHPHQNSKIKNLSFVGGSVHPGGGIPLCLLSSNIAIDALD